MVTDPVITTEPNYLAAMRLFNNFTRSVARHGTAHRVNRYHILLGERDRLRKSEVLRGFLRGKHRLHDDEGWIWQRGSSAPYQLDPVHTRHHPVRPLLSMAFSK